MISPAQQKVIQIDITNACPNKCGNCTRFVGHHRKPFMMSFDIFKQAIDSMKGFPGMIGIMGGEPTLHPQFDEFVEYAKSQVREPLRMPGGRYLPQPDFGAYANQNTSSLSNRKLGLWSSLGDGYYKHFELIQNTFGYQCLNDHKHKGQHISLLMTRKELGITDEQWLPLRDNCWIQREWSASITPKGAFFCEVAAALDTLYDGPGGWPIVDGWWKRTPQQFADQLQWCEMCSACLPVPRVKAADEYDTISPFHETKLLSVGSPRQAAGRTVVINLSEYKAKNYEVNQSCEPYLDPDAGKSCRIASDNRTLKPRKIQIIIPCLHYDDYLKITLPRNIKEHADIAVVTSHEDFKTHKVCKDNRVLCLISARININKAPFAKGKAINDAIDFLKPTDWVLVIDSDILLQKGMMNRLREMVLNPGALYYTRRWGPKDLDGITHVVRDYDAGMDIDHLFKHHANPEMAHATNRLGNAIEAFPYGYFQLFNVRAECLRGRHKLYEERFATAEMDDSNFGLVIYSTDKRYALPQPAFDVIHLPHGTFKKNWAGRVTARIDQEAQVNAG